MGSPSSGDDELPSLLRRSHISTTYEHDRIFDSRNSEDVHKTALTAALTEHERIRDIALRAYQLNEAREETEKLRQRAIQEAEALRIEQERAAEECRLRDIENKARSIPKPAPRIPTPPPVETPKPTAPTPPPPAQKLAPQQPQIQTPQPAHSTTPQQASPVNSSKPVQSTAPHASFHQAAPSLQFQQPSAPPVQPPQPSPAKLPSQPISNLLPGTERYAEIHKTLKQLRKFVLDAGKKNQQFKIATGQMRRELTKSCGQLTIGRGVNKKPTESIIALLKRSLTDIPSEGIDPSMVMLSKPNPKDDAINNGETMPSLFIYLMNHFSKAVVSQFATQAGVNAESADPLGVLVASVFARSELKWRDEPLIDILMAKIWKVCPVLFGARGNEKGENGRARLGWKKDENGDWVPEQEHSTRMSGFGAGYAAISLRNFAASKLQNPWPPYHYWQSMASILSTPSELASPTQYTVLKGMIELFEGRFMEFYGDAARAALRVALVDFPDRALDQKEVAVNSLRVLADKLERDQGLVLR